MSIKSKNIIQFSPIRSGSTLVYNILREFSNVIKTHNMSVKNGQLYVITYRHPYNCIISSLLRNERKINSSNIKSEISEYLKNGGKDLLKNDLLKKNILLLQYEEFFNNYEVIYNKLEKFLNINIDENKKIELSKKYHITNVKKITNKYKKFKEYDKTTHLHGKHISEYNGQTDYKKILSENDIYMLKENKNLNEIIKKFNYEL
tara:strand:+ start:4565 stop:5176 length:612 start_codon:yes stop_codon:yes gene_type:complete